MQILQNFINGFYFEQNYAKDNSEYAQ